MLFVLISGERPHYCTLCDKGFQTSSDLKRHKRTRVHQERVEQLKAEGGAGDTSNPDNSNNDFNRWVDDDDEDDDVSRDKVVHHMKSNVNSTAQQLLTNITQPVNIVNANGQSIESTIDLKALGGQPGGGNQGGSMPSAPMAVPVSTSWTTDAGTSSAGHGHYDLKDLSSSAANDVDLLIQHHNSVATTTTTSASMPSIVDLHHHHHQDVHQRQLMQHQQQIFLHEQQFQDIPTSSQDLTLKKVGVVVGDIKGAMDSPHDEEERLTVVEDDESSSNPVA